MWGLLQSGRGPLTGFFVQIGVLLVLLRKFKSKEIHHPARSEKIFFRLCNHFSLQRPKIRPANISNEVSSGGSFPSLEFGTLCIRKLYARVNRLYVCVYIKWERNVSFTHPRPNYLSPYRSFRTVCPTWLMSFVLALKAPRKNGTYCIFQL